MNNTIETVPNSKGMRVLEEGVVHLETTEVAQLVVLRNITVLFWQACINTVDTRDEHNRVCAVGTPGLGKTITTSVLIRMLLKKGPTVVYLVRTQRTK